MNRDIRLMNVRSAVGNTDRAGELEVCVNSSWATVCATGGWHNTQPGIENSRVACRQLGYREEGILPPLTTPLEFWLCTQEVHTVPHVMDFPQQLLVSDKGTAMAMNYN